MHSLDEANHACLSCGSALQGAFCSNCGEPAVHDGDLSMKHMSHEFLHEFTHIDGKIWRTLKALLFQPGLLTAEYWAGRRGLWIRPLRLYLVISALTLLLAANAAGPLGFRVWVDQAHNYTVGTRPVEKPNAAPVDAEFSHHVQSVYIWLRYLSLGVFAAASLAAYRKKRPLYGAHLIFAMHFYSFEYLVSAVRERTWSQINPTVTLGLGFLYLFLALRYVYKEAWWRTTLKSIWLFFSVAVAEMLIVFISVALAARVWEHR